MDFSPTVNASGSLLLACASFDANVTVLKCHWNSQSELLSALKKAADEKTSTSQGALDVFSIWETISGHESEVKCASFSPKSRYLATCSRDKAVFIYGLEGESVGILGETRSVM